MITEYSILLIFLCSLVFFIYIEVEFAERLQQTSTYINYPSLINRRLVEIGFYCRIMNMIGEGWTDHLWKVKDNWDQEV